MGTRPSQQSTTQLPIQKPEESQQIFVTSNRYPQNQFVAPPQVHPMEGNYSGYPSNFDPSQQQVANQWPSMAKGDQSGMLIPIMPTSAKANPLFPWTENILYLQGEEKTVNLMRGTPIPDVLEGVQIPFLKRIPINFQEYKESLAVKQGIPLPQNSITEIAKEYQSTGFIRQQGWILQKQLKLNNLLMPAQDQPDPIYFWCPVCDDINQTEIHVNGCCPGILRHSKTIRTDKFSEKLSCLEWVCLFFPLVWLFLILVFFLEYFQHRNAKVHLCMKCKRVVGASGSSQNVPRYPYVRVRRGQHSSGQMGHFQ